MTRPATVLTDMDVGNAGVVGSIHRPDMAGTRYIHAGERPLTYFRTFAADVANRTEFAMPQQHVFTVCRLALQAQARAERFVAS